MCRYYRVALRLETPELGCPAPRPAQPQPGQTLEVSLLRAAAIQPGVTIFVYLPFKNISEEDVTSPELGDTVEVDEPLDLELEILDGRHQLLLPRLGAQQSATPSIIYYIYISIASC